MKTLSSLEELSVLKNNSPEYKGKLPNYQQNGSKQDRKKHKQYEQHRLTPYQNLLYKRAIMGLTIYKKKELDEMHWEKRRRIKRVHRKAQTQLNLMKQERVNVLCDKLYRDIFSTSELAKNVFSLEKSATDPKIMNTLELKSLGITKGHIVKRLVHEGILPKDFYNLKEAV